MVKFDFTPDISNKYDDWFFEFLYENLKERNKLKKFLEIEKKKFKKKKDSVEYDYDLILSKLQKKKFQNQIINILKKIPPNVIEEWKEDFSSMKNRKKWKDYVKKNQFKDTYVLTPTWIKYIIQFENLNIPITQKLLKQKFPIKKYITNANIKKTLLDVLKDFYNDYSLFDDGISIIFFSKWKKNILNESSEVITRKFFKIVLLQELKKNT
ncbi:uncharacterized protein METZ01_LOCUS75569 [marine metagenome]|uniref:Uncharacterized protein n=1 Tax=marine metagenome TaxID=408172 RepID=A0A381U3A0_9ZZZZ